MRRPIIQEFVLPSLFITFFAFLPFFANSNLLLNRNNDLTEFFWPIFYFIKQFIQIHHSIPLVNELFFAGTPLISDPQNPIWYMPNIIFLFLKVDTAIFVSLFIHLFFGSLGSLLVSRKLFKWNFQTSIIVSILYIFSSQLFSFLEAGHWGLILFWSWLPYLLLSSFHLSKRPNWKIIVLFSLSASSIYFAHVLTFLICISVLIMYFLTQKKFLYPFFGLVLTFIIISPALASQLSWQGQTTRHLLLNHPEVFPIWRGKKELIKTIFLFNPETEKAITIGFFGAIFSIWGFLKVSKKNQILLMFIFLFLSLIVSNNVSPVINILLKVDFYVLARVTTRLWFLVFLIYLFLIGNLLNKIKPKFQIVLGVILSIESMFISYSYINKSIPDKIDLPETLYQTLQQDSSNFRVLCVTHCIPQKEAALRNIKLVDGYGTLQNLEFYYGLQDALNTTWTGYSLLLPPFETHNRNIQPNAKNLIKYNTKYLISKNSIKSSDFQLVKESHDYYLYKNELWKHQ